jgi:predicted dehydrogenase
MDNVEIVAIADPNRDAVNKILSLPFLESVNIAVYDNSDDMYQKSQIDAVMSATPDRFHLRDITDALNN